MRPISQLVVHCSATPEGRDIDIRDIDAWHRAKGWNGVGYHFVIKLDGTIQVGRAVDKIGAHVEGHNANSIGICMIGGCDAHMQPKNTFTPAQFKALHALLHDLLHHHPGAEVLGHRDFPGVAKACPSFDVRKWWAPDGHDRLGLPL